MNDKWSIMNDVDWWWMDDKWSIWIYEYEQHTNEWWMEYSEWCRLTMNGGWMVNMNIWIWMLRLIITYIIQTLFAKSYNNILMNCEWSIMNDVNWRWMDDEWWIWIYEYECYI